MNKIKIVFILFMSMPISFVFAEITETSSRPEISARFVRPPCAFNGLDFINSAGGYIPVEQAKNDPRCPRLRDYSVPLNRHAARIANASVLRINFEGTTQVINNSETSYTIINPTVLINGQSLPVLKGSEYNLCQLFGRQTNLTSEGRNIFYDTASYNESEVRGVKLGNAGYNGTLEDNQALEEPIRLIVCSLGPQ